ncbi:MAG: Flp pilus assembly complex ATPase component TadA [Firmicutes bacterium]|nr:Flp pilus assembly complex ATPase component TadA [Bacillota bacterium]
MKQEQIFSEFFNLCDAVEAILEREWNSSEEWEKQQRLEREKKAIMGYEEETRFYKHKIENILSNMHSVENMAIPPWYTSPSEGIFAELYGMAGLSPWVYDETDEYKNSSSAKLIGERMYCLINGRSVLQPQRISENRRKQLKRAFLLTAPKERDEKGFHELYLNNGIRITIYSGDRTKKGQDVMVFRKYVLRELTFERLAELGTIPSDSVELFKVMVRIGFNVLFSGQVRAGKTAFMQVWQKNEDPSLEGLAISTDPETPWHIIMPYAPVMQILADGKELEVLYKSLLRGDNDYILLEEMRDAAAFKLAIDITSIGTSRSKATIHSGSPVDIPYKMASAVASEYGGNIKAMISQIYRNFHYVFQLYQVPYDRSIKKLKSISEYRYDESGDIVSVHTVCRYDEKSGKWQWKYDIGEDKREMGKLQPDEFKRMEDMLKLLEKRNPIMENNVIYPRYYVGGGGDEDNR